MTHTTNIGFRTTQLSSLLSLQNKQMIFNIKNKTKFIEGRLVFLIFKNATRVKTELILEYQEHKMSFFKFCFILYFLKLSTCQNV